MQAVPYLFTDAVCHHLRCPKSILNVAQLSGMWSTVGSEHNQKRRYFQFKCTVYMQQCSYRITELGTSKFCNQYSPCFPMGSMANTDFCPNICDLDPKYDRITEVDFELYDKRRIQVSRDEFQRMVLPTVALLVMDCSWPIFTPVQSMECNLFFRAFKNCPGFEKIHVETDSPLSRTFVAQQVELGNVRELYLHQKKLILAEPENHNSLLAILKKFVSSESFRQLYAPGPLPNDFELAELFLERALAGELEEDARIWLQKPTFEKNRIEALRPECSAHVFSGELTRFQWWAPNLNPKLHKSVCCAVLAPFLVDDGVAESTDSSRSDVADEFFMVRPRTAERRTTAPECAQLGLGWIGSVPTTGRSRRSWYFEDGVLRSGGRVVDGTWVPERLPCRGIIRQRRLFGRESTRAS